MARPLRGCGPAGPRRSEPRAASLPAPHLAAGRGGDLRGSPTASELGPGEALGLACAAASGLGPARHQHRRGPARPPQAREEAAPPPSLRASGRGAADHDAAQRPLDRGFQGALPHARRDLLLPADDRRPAHPLSPGVPRPALDQGPRRAPDLRPPLSRVWPAPRDSHRQRRALRHDWNSRSLATQRVVAAPGHSAPTDPPSLASPERRPRTHAQDPEGRSDSPTPIEPPNPATGLHGLPPPL